MNREAEPKLVDAVIVGAGAVGISTAYHLASEGASVAVIEKESGPAMHQSGRNSGVVHAGYNLAPGSLKAQFCVEGNRLLREFCYENGVPIREGGILIIAKTEDDMPVINELERRGNANGTEVRVVDSDEIAEIEPHTQGHAALQAKDGASFDSRAYVQSLASHAISEGTVVLYDRQVKSINESGDSVVTVTNKGVLKSKIAINTAGLYADLLADDLARDIRVIPFRGYYAELSPDKTHLVNSHVYAAPDLDFPFLGIHLSKRTDGRVIAGPGAMLAFGREAYSFMNFEGGGLAKTLAWPGFYRMMVRPEIRNLLRQEIKKSLLLRAIGREAMQLIPELTEEDFVRSYAGNRAQLVNRAGELVDDIVVRETQNTVHVLNVITPGLTCSLPFGKYLSSLAMQKL